VSDRNLIVGIVVVSLWTPPRSKKNEKPAPKPIEKMPGAERLGRFGECQMVDSANLETLANAYQRVMKVAPDSIDTKTKRKLVIGSLVEASTRGVQDEDILTDIAIAAVTRYRQSPFGPFVHDVLNWLARIKPG
jgi:hypothetical protein